MTIKILDAPGNKIGEVATAELLFGDGDGLLSGLRLIGFSVWTRRTGTGYNVTFPARQYQINGERRAFALLRPIEDAAAQHAIRDAIIEAYEAYQAANA